MASLADVVAAMDRRYHPGWAESWDAVGLVCGDPDASVERVHFAIDPVDVVVEEAVDRGADLLVTHHPLYLGGTTSVAATTPKGRVVQRLVTSGCGLLVAHTNADVAKPGVSDALTGLLGLADVRPIGLPAGDPLDKVVVFVPRGQADRLIDALAGAGAGELGDYSRCAFLTNGTGTFRPGEGASPAIGTVGEVERVEEVRVEMVLDRRRRAAVVQALLAAHPYEEPAYDVIALEATAGTRGLGRIGDLAATTTLAEFTATAARALPTTAWGVRAAGDPTQPVRTIAVCGGSGGSLASAAAADGADVLLTSDLKHHSTAESVADLGIALVDAAHWATEQPFLAAAASLLESDLAAQGITVETTVSSIVTDPWTVHCPSPEDP